MRLSQNRLRGNADMSCLRTAQILPRTLDRTRRRGWTRVPPQFRRLRLGWNGALCAAFALAVALGLCSPTRAQDTAPATRSEAQIPPVAPENYVIGAGDLLHLNVYQQPELSGYVRVNSDGRFRVAFGTTEIEAAGSTAAALNQQVAAALVTDQLVRFPRVDVQVVAVNSKPITIMGAVNHPTTVQAVRPQSLLEVLGEAGGLTQTAGSEVIVSRPGAGDLHLTMAQVLIDPASNPMLGGGEVVRVIPGGKIFVAGAVGEPGAYDMGPGDQITALKAMALGKGPTSAANLSQAIVIRQVDGKPTEIPVNLQLVQERHQGDVPLMANDTLYIPVNGTKKLSMNAISSTVTALTYAGGLILAAH